MPHASTTTVTGAFRSTRDLEIEAAARALLDALDRQHGRVHMSLNVLEARGALRDLLPRVTVPPDPNDRAE